MKKLILLVTFVFAALAARAQCGTERWAVKTLQDNGVRGIHFTAASATVHMLRIPKAPDNLRKLSPAVRLPVENQVYTVHALLIGFKREADSDYHLVLADPQHPAETMIAEIPSPRCAANTYAQKFVAAANFVDGVHSASPKFYKLKQPLPVVVQGVFFFDFIHGQTGVAPNGAELHPVLSIARDK